MRAGKLRHRVAVEQDTLTRDADGHAGRAWTHVGYGWAQLSPMKGREFWAATAVVGEQPHDVTLRYDSRFAAMVPNTWRLVHGTTTYHVQNVVNVDERNRTVQLICTTGTAVRHA